MIESTPFITPADPLPQTTTSFVTSQVPVVTSQIVSTPVAVPQVSMVPQTAVSMVPQAAVSMVPQAAVSMVPQAAIAQPQKPAFSGVKVVPIYDDF